MTVKDIAMITYEADKAFCKAQRKYYSAVVWELIPEWKKEDIVASVQYNLENPGFKSIDNHGKLFDAIVNSLRHLVKED